MRNDLVNLCEADGADRLSQFGHVLWRLITNFSAYHLLCTPVLQPRRAASHHILVNGVVYHFVLSKFVGGESIFKNRFDTLALMSKHTDFGKFPNLELN